MTPATSTRRRCSHSPARRASPRRRSCSRPRAGATYRNRIWDTEHEMPFAGHPSLGTAVAVARARGDRTAQYVQQTPAGLQAVTVELDAGARRARASVLEEPVRFGTVVDVAATLRAAGLDGADASADVAPQVVSTGAPQLVCLVRDVAGLERVRPDPQALRALQDAHATTVLYLAWW